MADNTTYPNGDSFQFLNRRYRIGKMEKLQVGDFVTIHPVKAKPSDPYTATGFKSQAIKSYPARITVKVIPWIKDAHKYADYNIMNHKNELCLEGVDGNKNWHGAVLNEWGFNRLEFVKRKEA